MRAKLCVHQNGAASIQAKVRKVPVGLGKKLGGLPWGVDGEFKHRILLQWDAFEGGWSIFLGAGDVLAVDIAPISQDFDTHNAVPPSS